MSFEEYQKKSRATVIYPNAGHNFIYPTLGLVGESGEVAEKVKKALRDNQGVMDDSRRKAIKDELGDVLWYLAQIATELNLSLEDIAQGNLQKLASRQERGKLHGQGDNR